MGRRGRGRAAGPRGPPPPPLGRRPAGLARAGGGGGVPRWARPRSRGGEGAAADARAPAAWLRPGPRPGARNAALAMTSQKRLKFNDRSERGPVSWLPADAAAGEAAGAAPGRARAAGRRGSWSRGVTSPHPEPGQHGGCRAPAAPAARRAGPGDWAPGSQPAAPASLPRPDLRRRWRPGLRLRGGSPSPPPAPAPAPAPTRVALSAAAGTALLAAEARPAGCGIALLLPLLFSTHYPPLLPISPSSCSTSPSPLYSTHSIL